MGDDPSLEGTAIMLPPSQVTNTFLPPGQAKAPPDLCPDHHGYTLRFQFHPPHTPAQHIAKFTRSDTFNAVEALRGLADALFTFAGNIAIDDTSQGATIKTLQDWSTTDIQFRSFFENYLPPTGKATAYVRCNISTFLCLQDAQARWRAV
ncbi:hypothetical protein ACA910_007362 [Epithemia clementina (nom. ined.)]